MSSALSRLALLGLLAAVAACAARPSTQDYIAYQAVKQAEGKLRADTEPADAPFGPDDLVLNFERIALHHEADAARPGNEANWADNPITRWHGALRYALIGRAVRPEDRDETARLMARIAGLTGLDIREDADEPNFLIVITTTDERNERLEFLADISPVMARTFRFWHDHPAVVCVANNIFGGPDGNRLTGGLVVIGAEVTGLLRRACLHEEIVQALGLANDHPKVRPSLFNDDGEFALLTRHDEFLLRILYDPRIRTGMAADEAMPVVRSIVADLDLGAAPAPVLAVRAQGS